MTHIDMVSPHNRRRQGFTPSDIETYQELITRPHIARLTPQNRITAAKSAWFAADMEHAAAFLRADSNAMAWASLQAEAILDSYILFCHFETLDTLTHTPQTPTPAAPEPEEFPDNLPLEPLQADEFRPTPATTRDKRVQTKAELRCYAVARDHGLNPHSAASMRNAFNNFNGTNHASRADFSEDEWKQFARDIESCVWILEWKQVLFKTRQVAA